ncbi:hypothetical protein NKI59_26425 [Mesorhizobium sp. M0598]|uniref:hypothetical protein n=1 Tax=Mesorhizobium sp. M0598 TaxID=2956968 RepID=UPI003336A4D8
MVASQERPSCLLSARGRPVCRPPFLKIALSRTAFDTEKNASAPKWFPADWFFRRAIARLSPSDVLARAAAARRECGKSKKLTQRAKKSIRILSIFV